MLVCGPTETEKTTTVRGIAAVTRDKRYVEIPLDATPEQMFSTIDLNETISNGRRIIVNSIMKCADETSWWPTTSTSSRKD